MESEVRTQGNAMTKTELKSLRQQLLDLGQRLKGDVSSLEEEALRDIGGGELSNTPLHLADLGSDTFEQEVNVNLLQNEEQQLEQIATALQRMERGTYGRGESCGQGIGIERLKAR